MGIPGLLPFVRKACYEGNLNEFEGKTLLVDASCLLHRGLFGCATKMAMGQDTEFYVGYVRKYVNFLLSQKCHVILVFDGRPLPAKKECNDSRRETRKGYKQLGEELMRQGLTYEADKAFTRGTEITSEVVEKTIRSFNQVEKVDVLVAPYEADAQIAYLIQNGFAYAVVTEDSDLIVYGCDKIIFKMNPINGVCQIYDKEKLANCLCPLLRRRFQFSTFRRICILAGCDYFKGGLQGVGLKGAEEIFAKTNQPDLKTLLPRLPLYLNKRLRLKIDRDFISDFIKAENTFLYQIVFDPMMKEQVPLNPHPPEQENSPTKSASCKYSYAGCILSSQKAIRLALGNAENRLHLPTMEDYFALSSEIPEWSIWNGQYKKLVVRENEQREKRLDERFGAFRPAKSPIKRPAATKVVDLHSMTMPLSSADVKEMEEQLDSRVKRKRLSEIQLSPIPAKNGAYSNWNCEDWLRKYGIGNMGNDNKQ